MKPLFTKVDPGLEKRAYAVRLDKSSDDWAVGILKTAYKQLPYLRKYEVDVELDRIDEPKGYCVGKMLVYPAGMKKNAAVKDEKIVSFPVIVRDREVSPFDVYSHDNSMFPADERGVSEVLMKNTVFDRPASPKNFRGTDLGAQLDPPSQRLRHATGRSFHKTASVMDLAMVYADDYQKEDFKMALRAQPHLRVAAVNNPAFGQAVDRVLNTKVASAKNIRDIREVLTDPDVVSIEQDGMNYVVRSASSDCYSVKTASATHFEVKGSLPEHLMSELKRNGHVTVVKNPVAYKEVVKEASIASRTGAYSVHCGSDELHGIVIPKMVSLDGDAVGGQLFLSDNGHAIQEKIAGVMHGSVRIPSMDPHGMGVFIYQKAGAAFATEPVEITNAMSTRTLGQEKTAHYLAKRMWTGEDITIREIPSLTKIAKIGNREYGIPSSMNFIPLSGDQVKVASDPSVANQMSMAKVASENALELVSDGGYFSIRGNSPFSGKMYNAKDVEFVLGAHGVNAKSLIKEAASAFAPVRIPHSRNVFLEEEVQINELKNAQSFNVDNIRCDLIKEASVIVDKETVDSILALRFVTPENVSSYVGFIPELEKTASKLAEILIASRLGMDNVKEAAAKNAMSQLNRVIRDLRQIGAQIS